MTKLALWIALALVSFAGVANATPPVPTMADTQTDFPTNERVHITFDQPMDEATIVTANCFITLAGTPIAQTCRYRPATNACSIRPDVPLAINTVYGVTIVSGSSGVKTDPAGEELAEDWTTTFSTASYYAPFVEVGPGVDISHGVEMK